MGKEREAGIGKRFDKMEGTFQVQKRLYILIYYAGKNIILELQRLELIVFFTLAPGKPNYSRPSAIGKGNLCSLSNCPSIVFVYG